MVRKISFSWFPLEIAEAFSLGDRDVFLADGEVLPCCRQTNSGEFVPFVAGAAFVVVAEESSEESAISSQCPLKKVFESNSLVGSERPVLVPANT